MPSILPTQINEPPQRKFFSKITSTKNHHTRHVLSGNNSDDNTYDKIPLDTHNTTPHHRHHTALQHHVSLSDNSKFLLCCFMWYICSSLSSNTAKQIMNTFKYPVTLTFVQFLMVSCWCAFMERVFKSSGIKKPTKTIVQTIVPLSSFMIVGHVFSSISISRIPVSLVHTIKVSAGEVKEKGAVSRLKSTLLRHWRPCSPCCFIDSSLTCTTRPKCTRRWFRWRWAWFWRARLRSPTTWLGWDAPFAPV